MPQPGVQAGSRPDDFWAQFSAMSERNPQAAWQMLSQAGLMLCAAKFSSLKADQYSAPASGAFSYESSSLSKYQRRNA